MDEGPELGGVADEVRFGLQLRPLTPVDVRYAAALHRRALPHGFFAGLGLGYLRAYYVTFVEGPDAVGLLALVDGTPAGVLVGTLRNRAHYTWVMRKGGRRLCLWGVVGLLTHPRVAVAFLRTRLRRYLRGCRRLRRGAGAGSVGAAAAGSQRDVAVLTHVAVDDQARGLGIGSALVDAFSSLADQGGASHAELVTLCGNHGAAGFYDRLGWTAVIDRLDRDGRPVRVYRRELAGDR